MPYQKRVALKEPEKPFRPLKSGTNVDLDKTVDLWLRRLVLSFVSCAPSSFAMPPADKSERSRFSFPNPGFRKASTQG